MNRSHRARGACAAITLLALVGCAATPPPKDPAQAAAATPADAASPSSAATDQPSSTSRLPAEHKTSLPRVFGWVSVAIGAQAAVVAITTSFLMLHQNAVRSDECNAQKICSPAGIDANSKLDAYVPWNAGSWALAAVGVGVGAYLILSNPPESQKETAIGVGPNGSGMGLNLRSTF